MTEAELRNGIDKIIRNNDIDTAIHNIKGYMRLRYGHPFLCEKLANLYIEKKDFRQAGKYIFYKEHLSKQDKEILSIYFKYFGGDTINILKDLIAEGTKSPVRIEYDVKVELLIMMNEVKAENGFLPKFMWNWYYHFESELKKDKRHGQLSQSTRR